MAPKNASSGPDGSNWRPVRDVMEVLEQAVAGGWYPARRRLMAGLAAVPQPELPVWVPEADLEENARELVVTVALPGVEKADIRVEAHEDALTVSGHRREDGSAGFDACRREQPRGEFLRRIRLPVEVKPQGAKASYRNGVLRVSLPRSKAAFGRSVKVE